MWYKAFQNKNFENKIIVLVKLLRPREHPNISLHLKQATKLFESYHVNEE